MQRLTGHGADTDNTLWKRSENAGWKALAQGARHLRFRDDHERNAAERIVQDALYAHCREHTTQGLRQSFPSTKEHHMSQPQRLNRRQVLPTARVLGIDATAGASSGVASAGLPFTEGSGPSTGQLEPLKHERFPACSLRCCTTIAYRFCGSAAGR